MARGILLIVTVGLFALAAAPSFASDNSDNCHRLEALSQQYAGIELTSYQKQIKRQLVVWYGKNCRYPRSAQAD